MDIIPGKRGDVQMKKVFASLSPLRKVRPRRKVLLVGGYLLVVALMIVAVTWRGIATEPMQILPPANLDTNPAEDEVVTRPDPPFNAVDEPDVIDGVLPEETTPVLAVPTDPMQWPLEGQILTAHHEVYRLGNRLRAHVGVDIEAIAGSEVRAAWPGSVDRVTQDPRLGWLIEIRHGGGHLTQYANLQEEPFFSLGDEVKTGQVIGNVGQSAKLDASEGAFLHFAVYKDGEALDPIAIISH